MLRAPVAVDIRLDDRPVVSETRWTRVGPDVVVIESTIPEPTLALTLTSTYLGCPGAHTAITHAAVLSGSAAATWSRHQPEPLLPVSSDQQRCLFDHLAQLRDVVGAA